MLDKENKIMREQLYKYLLSLTINDVFNKQEIYESLKDEEKEYIDLVVNNQEKTKKIIISWKKHNFYVEFILSSLNIVKAVIRHFGLTALARKLNISVVPHFERIYGVYANLSDSYYYLDINIFKRIKLWKHLRNLSNIIHKHLEDAEENEILKSAM